MITIFYKPTTGHIHSVCILKERNIIVMWEFCSHINKFYILENMTKWDFTMGSNCCNVFVFANEDNL